MLVALAEVVSRLDANEERAGFHWKNEGQVDRYKRNEQEIENYCSEVKDRVRRAVIASADQPHNLLPLFRRRARCPRTNLHHS